MSEIRVPTLGESIVEAVVSKWLKQEGDTITTGEPIVELETDKVNLEVAAEQDGVLGSIVKPEGETVGIGDVLAVVSENGQASTAEQPASAPAAQEREPAATERQSAEHGDTAPPAASEESSELQATPVALRVARENNVDVRQLAGSGPGGRVTKEDVLNYLQQDQPPRSQPRPAARPEAEPAATERQPAPDESRPAARSESVNQTPSPRPAFTPPAATPEPDTSRLGRATDAAPARQSASREQPAAPAPQAPATNGERPQERRRMSRRRQTIAKRLVEAQRTAAMLTTFNEIDMSAVMEVRKRRKEAFQERHGINLGFMSFFSRACVGALKAFPLLNAEIQGEEMIIKHYYDIGIAVGTEQGLVVPVVRDVDRKTFAQIEREIVELASRARENTLTLAELQGGTFSITNGGIYGSLMSTPILNAPQVGILGLHKIEPRPVVVDGEVQVRPMMYVALSYDHRIVDGSEAVRFLVRVKELMEDPEALLLEA